VPVMIITGDIAFFYDSNALWHHHLKSNLKIIMINNAGGNIFRYVKGPEQTDHLEKHFEATHQTKANHLAAMHGIHYFSAEDEDSLSAMLPKFFAADDVAILEVHTPRELNIKLLKQYFHFISPQFPPE